MIAADLHDLVCCYRLLLGRNPDPDGFRGYAALIEAGYPATDLADLFYHSPEAAALRARRQSAEIVEVAIPGSSMLVVPAWNDINRSIAGGDYEPHVTALFREFVRPGMIVADVGANVGYFSVLASSLGATVHAFEPNSRNIWLLNRNAERSGGISVYPYALGDSPQLVSYVPLMGNGQIADLGDTPPGEGVEVLRLEMLDRLLAGVKFDFMKIDVEGAEGLVLQGATQTLAHRPVIVTEFVPSSLARISKMSAKAFLDILDAHRYRYEACFKTGARQPISSEALLDLAALERTDMMDFVAFPED